MAPKTTPKQRNIQSPPIREICDECLGEYPVNAPLRESCRTGQNGTAPQRKLHSFFVLAHNSCEDHLGRDACHQISATAAARTRTISSLRCRNTSPNITLEPPSSVRQRS